MDLNTILIILGVIALLALVAHGIWSNRREKSQYFQNANTFSQNHQPNRFTAPNQAARPSAEPPIANKPVHSFVEENLPQQQNLDFDTTAPNSTGTQSIERAVDEIKITLPSGMSNNSVEPQYQSSQPTQSAVFNSPEQQPDTLNAMTQSSVQFQSYADTNRVSVTQMEEEYQTPTVSLTPVETERPHEEISQNHVAETVENNAPKGSKPPFVMLYVVAPENREFHGARLAQALEGLGFIFGDRHIYHRHLDLTPSSPVLFSLANLRQPNTFNPYDMENFSTVGIVLFMELPSPGNDIVNLKTMIRAARNLADELGGFVLTDKQEIFNDHTEQEYLASVA